MVLLGAIQKCHHGWWGIYNMIQWTSSHFLWWEVVTDASTKVNPPFLQVIWESKGSKVCGTGLAAGLFGWVPRHSLPRQWLKPAKCSTSHKNGLFTFSPKMAKGAFCLIICLLLHIKHLNIGSLLQHCTSHSFLWSRCKELGMHGSFWNVLIPKSILLGR